MSIYLSACFLLNTSVRYLDLTQLHNTQSTYDCQLACQNEPQCRFIVYEAPNVFCWMKTGVAAPLFNQSGMILSPAFCEGNLLQVNCYTVCWARNFVFIQIMLN